MRTPNALTALALIAISAPIAAAQDLVEYQIEFVAEWSAANHPTAFPPNPHFSPVIGATHRPSTQLWSPSGIASNGIEQMAETGAPTTLRNEVLALIDDAQADQFINLGSVPLSPGSRSGTISVDTSFPLLSLVTMIAPSPDWFVGIHDIDLRPGGIWARELVFDLDPYDSGTDAGTTYVAPNADITPHLPIANISDEFPFTGTGRIGTFSVTLVSDAACSLSDLAEPYETLDFFDVSAFINAYNAQDSAADFDSNGTFDFFDVSAFISSYSSGCP